MNSIYQNDFKNQKVLIRVDFNVPLSNKKVVTDNSRIVAAKKTAPQIESKKIQEKKDKNDKSKTVAEIDRDKLDKKFSKKKEEKLN